MTRRNQGASRGATQIALLVLPLLVLLLLGAYFIERDRRWVLQDARDRARTIAHTALDRLYRAAADADLNSYFTLSNEWPAGTAFFQTDSASELIFPPAVLAAEPGDPLASLDPVQTILWREAEHAEFVAGDLDVASHAWRSLLDTEPPQSARAAARLKLAVLLEKTGQTNEAYQALARLLDEPASSVSEAGIPVAHFAALKLLDHVRRSGGERDSAVALFIRKSILNHLNEPSEFTGYFLETGAKNTVSQPLFKSALKTWKDHQLARRLHATWREKKGTNSIPSVIELDRQRWWSFGDATNILLRTEENLQTVLNQLRSDLGAPDYLSLVFGGRVDRGEVLARAGETEPRISVVLNDPGALYAVQRQRAWLFGGVLVSSGLLAGAGVLQIRRNFRRQEKLNELKSNFVSSVSHELRAPLASMRLISEGLQSGRVRDVEKQREYFEFLVQECRRLSGLVENVLDFSRIEQNRKTYTFAPVDVIELSERALKTMAPVAREQGVALKLEASGAATGEVDAMAVQQAMVNLLDNAVKHSRDGDPVTLCVRSDSGWIEISVEDRGCDQFAQVHHECATIHAWSGRLRTSDASSDTRSFPPDSLAEYSRAVLRSQCRTCSLT